MLNLSLFSDIQCYLQIGIMILDFKEWNNLRTRRISQKVADTAIFLFWNDILGLRKKVLSFLKSRDAMLNISSDFGLESQWSACRILITHLMLEKRTFFYNLWSMQNMKMIILFDPASATSKNFKYHSRRKPATHTHILQYVICQCKNLFNNTKNLTVGNGSIILWHSYYCYFIIGNYILNST